MVAKRFFYICAGILCLALAYHFGAMNAQAQASGPVQVEIVNVRPSVWDGLSTLGLPIGVRVVNEPLPVTCSNCGQ
jgi:hypothetical protein